jgi:hypothetical protein
MAQCNQAKGSKNKGNTLSNGPAIRLNTIHGNPLPTSGTLQKPSHNTGQGTNNKQTLCHFTFLYIRHTRLPSSSLFPTFLPSLSLKLARSKALHHLTTVCITPHPFTINNLSVHSTLLNSQCININLKIIRWQQEVVNTLEIATILKAVEHGPVGRRVWVSVGPGLGRRPDTHRYTYVIA